MTNSLRRISSFLFIIGALNLSAQKQNNNWYFGNGAGISFSNGIAVPLKNGELFTEEGCATISDLSGNLLFYTNGIKVWDANHQMMDGGTSLAGGISTTQSATILPYPGKENQFIIFTADEKAGAKGLSYSIVDMTKRVEKGNVIIKNKFMYGPISEKLTTAKHSNGKDYWVITHQWNTNTFAAFLVSEKGVSGSPVLSKIGTVHKDFGSGNKGESIGQIKVSPNGKMLASTMCYYPNNPVELYDFNPATGEISNLKEIPTSGFAYGVEFSPDNTKLYVSFLKGSVGVIQYDLSASDLFDSSVILAKENPKSVFGALQLGPDNRIYVAKTGRYLDIITNPNSKGTASGYKLGGVNLGDRNCVYGLPSMILSHGKSAPSTVNESVSISDKSEDPRKKERLCAEYIELDAEHEGSVFLWSTGETTQKIRVSHIGSYTVKISEPDNIQSESVNFVVNKGEPKVNLGPDTNLVCIRNYTLNAKNRGYKYQWSTKDTTQTIEVTRSGKYSVTVSNGDCWARDTVYVSFDSYPPKFKALPSFSPTNSGFNNQFDFSVGDVSEFYLEVTTEKGKLIWKTESKDDRWKGKDKKNEMVEKGNYNWKVRYKGPCTNGETIEESGTVRLY